MKLVCGATSPLALGCKRSPPHWPRRRCRHRCPRRWRHPRPRRPCRVRRCLRPKERPRPRSVLPAWGLPGRQARTAPRSSGSFRARSVWPHEVEHLELSSRSVRRCRGLSTWGSFSLLFWCRFPLGRQGLQGNGAGHGSMARDKGSQARTPECRHRGPSLHWLRTCGSSGGSTCAPSQAPCSDVVAPPLSRRGGRAPARGWAGATTSGAPEHRAASTRRWSISVSQNAARLVVPGIVGAQQGPAELRRKGAGCRHRSPSCCQW